MINNLPSTLIVAVLVNNPAEIPAAHCKVVALIQVSKFQEALTFIERNKLTAPLVFERAYAEYRLNQPERALRTIDEHPEQRPLPAALKELRAQVLYRLEQFDECFDAYKDIVKNTSDDYEDERATNLSAVAVHLAIEESPKDVSNLRDDTYELCYNSACALAGRGQYADAERKLRHSEKLARDFLEEDGATEDDIADEVAIIRVQLAYCLQQQGRIKDAAVIYGEALKRKTQDAALVAVASNNTVSINKDQNVFDSKKKMRAAMTEASEQKLTRRQNKTIAVNNCLLTLFTSQTTEQAQQLVQKLIAAYPDLEFEGQLIRVCQLMQEKRHREAVELLERFAAGRPERRLATKFAQVQILLSGGNRRAAIEVLQSLDEERYRPGVVSALVSLLLGTDQKLAASQVLKDAVEWYQRHQKKGQSGSAVGNDAGLTEMWRQAADFHLRGGQVEVAASSLEELLRQNPQDMRTLAQLVIAYAQYDRKRAQEISKRLPALDTLTNATEIDALEATNWMMSTKAVRRTAGGKSEPSPGVSGGDAAKARKRRVRKRKGALPKNYNIEVPADPERWLPKYERAGFRKRGGRRTKDVIKGSQGMQTGAADQ